MYEVHCHTFEEFTKCCAEFVREGVCFKADASSLTITFTGGF
jgi:hypothetical protein